MPVKSVPPPELPKIRGWQDGLPLVPDAGRSSGSLSGGRFADSSQDAVIHAAPGARLVVEAGPGFGKTDVACARVAALVERGVSPAQILLLSFTRTAVREMRNRIASLVKDGVDVGGVQIRTLDSFSWHLRTAWSDGGDQSLNYQESIEKLLQVLRRPSEERRRYLENFEHVFVDEAQDLIGGRSQLIARILSLLSKEAGYTVFLDPAQAIYEWAEDGAGTTVEEGDFASLLMTADPPPVRHRLEVLHRTKEKKLRQLLLGARRLVLDDSYADRQTRIHQILCNRAEKTSIGGENITRTVQGAACSPDDLLVLFRRRAEVLVASSYLAAHEIPHRLRFGGLPRTVAPWLACLINEIALTRDISIIRPTHCEEAFTSLQASNPWLVKGWSIERMWTALLTLGRRASGSNSVDLRLVADALAAGRYPDDLLQKEIGFEGPILSTVHGSKGREAPAVAMVLQKDAPEEEVVEEARVLYVALSRAKEELKIYLNKRLYCGHLESGRAWQSMRGDMFRIEIGREGDINRVESLLVAGVEEDDMQLQQQWLAAYDGTIQNLKIRRKETCFEKWRWVIELPNEIPIASLDRSFEPDLSRAANRGANTKTCRAASRIDYVRWFDLTTTALSKDNALLSGVPEPWRSTRVWLTPVVSGFGKTYRNKNGKKS